MSTHKSHIAFKTELSQVQADFFSDGYVTDLSGIQNNFYKIWRSVSDGFGLSEARPFYDFIARYLQPKDAPLRTSTGYWNTIWSFFSPLYFNRRFYYTDDPPPGDRLFAAYYRKITLSDITVLAAWLQHTFQGIPYLPDMTVVWYFDLFYSKKDLWPHRKRFLECICGAIRRLEIQDLATVRYILDVAVLSLFSRLKPAYSPVTLRNMGAALVEFYAQKHAPIRVNTDTALIYFAHWCYRKKRRFAQIAGIDQWLGAYDFLKSVPVSRLKAWVPEFLLNKINIDGVLPVNTEHTVTAIRHILAGKSARTMPCLPFYLSAQAAHWMMHAPQRYEFYQAVLYGRIRALCPDEKLAQWLSDDFYQMIFMTVKNGTEEWGVESPKWRYVHHIDDAARFFGRFASEMHCSVSYPTYMDYLKQQWKTNVRFSLRGRTLAALQRRIQAWHDELAVQKVNRKVPLSWRGFRLRNDKVLGEGWMFFYFKQLKTQHDILLEGAVMHHCVAAYIPYCAAGQCAVWSMYRQTRAASDRHLTIELNTQKEVVQARGAYNRPPSETEYKVLKTWCMRNGLQLALR